MENLKRVSQNKSVKWTAIGSTVASAIFGVASVVNPEIARSVAMVIGTVGQAAGVCN